MSLGVPFQHVLVVGLGISGWSSITFLLSQQVRVIAIDTRAAPPYLGAAQGLSQQDDRLTVMICDAAGTQPENVVNQVAADIDAVVLSPGVDPRQSFLKVAIDKGIPLIGDVELAMRALKACCPYPKIIAVTGSNGKTTVTTWVAEVLQTLNYPVVACGNIGLPVLDLLHPDRLADVLKKIWVIELSSFQLESLESMVPEVAVCLNVVADHLDRYESLAEYAQVKHRIYRHAKHAVINVEDPLSYPDGLLTAPHCVVSRFDLFKKPLPLKLVGQHNQLNASAVLMILQQLGISEAAALGPLCAFQGLPHRCQWVGCINGIDWYNDSKATNVGAAISAITSLGGCTQGKLVVLLGGVLKPGSDYAELLPSLRRYARTVILFGQDRAVIKAELFKEQDSEQPFECLDVMKLADAIVKAHTKALPNDAVLLSPACASFDEFANYQVRGDFFIEHVGVGNVDFNTTPTSTGVKDFRWKQ